MVDLVPQRFEESTSARVQLADIHDLFKDVAKLLVQEQYFFLQELVLAGGRHLADTSQEKIDISCISRLDKVSEQ